MLLLKDKEGQIFMFGCFPLCAFVDGLQCGIIIFFAGLLLLVCAFVLVSFWFHPSAVYYLLDSGCYFAQKMKTSCWYCSERFFSVRFHWVQFEVFYFRSAVVHSFACVCR